MPVIPDTIWPYSFHRSDLAANLRRTKLNAIFFAANIKTARLSPIFHTFRTLGPRRLYRRDICPCIGREYRGGLGWDSDAATGVPFIYTAHVVVARGHERWKSRMENKKLESSKIIFVLKNKLKSIFFICFCNNGRRKIKREKCCHCSPRFSSPLLSLHSTIYKLWRATLERKLLKYYILAKKS